MDLFFFFFFFTIRENSTIVRNEIFIVEKSALTFVFTFDRFGFIDFRSSYSAFSGIHGMRILSNIP